MKHFHLLDACVRTVKEGKNKGRRVKEGKKIGRRKEEWKKERRKERENKLEYGRCLLISLVIQLNGEGQREEEPWNLGAGVSEAQVQASLKTLL